MEEERYEKMADTEATEITNSNSEVRTPSLRQQLTLPLIQATVICFLGSPLQFGYNLSVVNAPEAVSS